MKNKGFTLIETLAVITILSIIGVIIVIKVGESVNTAKNTLSKEQMNNLITATKKYVTENPDLLPEIDEQYDIVVTIDELIENGVIGNDKVIDPKTKEQINGCILITYNQDNNQYEYEYSTEICNITEGTQFKYDYTGGEQTFNAPRTGYYKLEVWGAQGGTTYSSGYGGYSVGTINLTKNEKLYINIGGQGTVEFEDEILGGYNGGGKGRRVSGTGSSASGGGATHIATQSGLLSSLETNKDKIIIVAGGGGGSGNWDSGLKAGSGGGYIGANGTDANSAYDFNKYGIGGTQSSGGYSYDNNTIGIGQFGQGGFYTGNQSNGGGGGYYGGGASSEKSAGGGGGSGYIGNNILKEKVMYCYGCEESNGTTTKTISTTGTSTERDTTNCPNGYSESPISKCAKVGNGYAIITYIGKIEEKNNKETNFVYTGGEQTFTAPKTGNYKIETWGAQGGTTYSSGYGGYSVGIINLTKNEKLYINIGGQGTVEFEVEILGGYNGGGKGRRVSGTGSSASGGGATHIATQSGLLSSLENDKDKIIIVAGGGGGSANWDSGLKAGSGGGYIGANGTDANSAYDFNKYGIGGTQSSGGYSYDNNTIGIGQFGQGGFYTGNQSNGGGGGYYGGGASSEKSAGGGGGSGYIGNNILKEKSMYCYNCQESNDKSTKTISTTGTSTERDTTNCPNGYSESPISKCAKVGNGYARITYLGKKIK